MILAIVALMFGAYLLFKSASKIMESLRNRQEREVDGENMSGPGTRLKNSKFGNNADLTS